MNETAREKRIRYLLILLLFLVIGAAFLIRTNKMFDGEQNANEMLALVVKESTNGAENPIVALYKENSGQHILTFYEIDLNNDFYFQAKKAITLRKAPTALANDKSGVGIWVKIGKRWIYFNQSLEQMLNDPENINTEYGQAIPFQQKREKNKITLIIESKNHPQIQLPLTSSKDPEKLHQLTKDGSLWLLIFEEEVKVTQVMT